MTAPLPYKTKLIEVALPLEDINRESAREKSIRHGHPSTLHLWWARRPLATCRAVIWASLVDDPSTPGYRDLAGQLCDTVEKQTVERERLFEILRRLVIWTNSNDPRVLAEARAEIMRGTDNNPPPVYDPFCGGGSIPLEAQRLGLEAHGSDLNPVAVLITKALIEIPPKWAGKPPVNPDDRAARLKNSSDWMGAKGLAADVRYYGQWMRTEAEKRIGHLYPTVTLPKEHGGGEGTVIAWLWARTVVCPNPACGCQMPLVRSFALSTKKGKESWVEPIVEPGAPPTIRFEVKSGRGKPREGTMTRTGGTCLVCGTSANHDYIRTYGQGEGMGSQLMAIVAEGNRARAYVSPDPKHVEIAKSAHPLWVPEGEIAKNTRDFRTALYGMPNFADLFTPRQLVALTTFSDLIGEARTRIEQDAIAAGLSGDGVGLESGGVGAKAYAEAVSVYLGFVLDKQADLGNSLCRWEPVAQCPRQLFGRQAIPMIWDFAEANSLGQSSGAWSVFLEGFVHAFQKAFTSSRIVRAGQVRNLDATKLSSETAFVVSTDPPYYDNIGYADLADFFYIWLRRGLGEMFPSLFTTLLVPKSPELVATPYRFGGSKAKAQSFFEQGLGSAFEAMRKVQHGEYPLTVYYAFKQSETEETSQLTGNSKKSATTTASTGWETMLSALIKAGFQITGTWPVRTENASRMVGQGTNALASSIVLVCRPRPEDAPLATKREFVATLHAELPEAIRLLQSGNIAPVDLAQASIGPGMAVFSRYSKVLESDGTAMPVRTALQLINQTLDEVLHAEDNDYDNDTRWAITWFEEHGFGEGKSGTAETLASAKNISVKGLETAGILVASKGIVHLKRPEELDAEWDPQADARLTVWETTHQLVRALDASEQAAANLLRRIGTGYAASAKQLAYRLYAICERKKWAKDGGGYNLLIVAWPELEKLSRQQAVAEQAVQQEMF